MPPLRLQIFYNTDFLPICRNLQEPERQSAAFYRQIILLKLSKWLPILPGRVVSGNPESSNRWLRGAEQKATMWPPGAAL
jgi:hypothetical protein